MDTFVSPSGALALMTLTFLEIVLGVDNVIFISILSSKLPGSQQDQADGTPFRMVMRILLLLFLVWIIKLTAPSLTSWGAHLRTRSHFDQRLPVPSG